MSTIKTSAGLAPSAGSVGESVPSPLIGFWEPQALLTYRRHFPQVLTSSSLCVSISAYIFLPFYKDRVILD